MTAGTFLPKGRLTYFCQNGTAYQAFYDNIKKHTKVLAYAPLGGSQYVNFAEFELSQRINTEEELKEIAEEKEKNYATQTYIDEPESKSGDEVTEANELWGWGAANLTEKEDKTHPDAPDFYILKGCSDCPGGIDRPNCFFCHKFELAIQRLGRLEDLLATDKLILK